MDDPDPSLVPAHAARLNAECRLAYDAAFDVLRSDLVGVRGSVDADVHRRGHFVLERLDTLRSLYLQHATLSGLGYVPSQAKDWALPHKLSVLRHLAVIIHNQHLANAAFGDDFSLIELWESGHLRAVERLCDEIRQRRATAASGDLRWLMENRGLRHVSEAAALAGRRLYPPRRSRRPRRAEQLELTARRSRSTIPRLPPHRSL